MRIEIQKREDKINNIEQPLYYVLTMTEGDKSWEYKFSPTLFLRLKAQIESLYNN